MEFKMELNSGEFKTLGEHNGVKMDSLEQSEDKIHVKQKAKVQLKDSFDKYKFKFYKFLLFYIYNFKYYNMIFFNLKIDHFFKLKNKKN